MNTSYHYCKGIRRIFAAAFFCLLGQLAFAQNVSVTGAVVGNGLYPDLTSAFTAINGGTQTGATIVVAIVGNTTESATATLNQGAWTSLSIAPSGGGARSITGNVNGPLVDLNGSDKVTIDGLNTGGNSLRIDNQSLGTTASTVRFINDAHLDNIQNCTILGAGASTTVGTVFFSTGTTTGNDSIVINNCTIDASSTGNPVNGVCSIGSATAGQENSTITLSNSNVANTYNASLLTTGILVGTGNSAWLIFTCRIYQGASRNYTTANIHNGIQVSSGNGHTISGNVIGYATSAATGTYTMTSSVATRFIGINVAVGTTAATSVQGNVITAINLSTSSGAATTNGVLCGINVTAGNVNVGSSGANIIGGASGNNLLVAVPTTTQGMVVGINSSSTNTVMIQNNIMGGFFSGGATPAVAGGIAGINVSGVATSMTITGNTIGNSSANNMQAGSLATTTGSSIVSGINMSSTPTTATVTGNTIQNLSAFGTGAGSFVRGIWTAAATGSSAFSNISSNVITNLTTNSTLTTITSGQAAACGINLSIGTNCTVNNNAISNISMTNTGANTGFCVGITQGNSTTPTISGNTISNITNASTSTTATAPGFAVGIVIRSGTTSVTVVNNMISLGSGATDNTAFVGILGNHGSTPDPIDRIYFNTVNITGTVTTGAIPSFCFHRGDYTATSRTQTVDVRNNIFTNSRTGGTGQHFAIGNGINNATSSATGWATNASNYNVLNATAATIGYWTSAQTFANWRTASASDANSFSNITVTYVNPASNLHLNMGTTPTLIESGGQTIAGITTDIDGNVRPGPAGSVNGGAFAPDLGADEFDGVPIDLLPPTITYTPLTFTCGTSDRTFTATISDITGVPTTGALQPRVYFRKNAGPWFSSQGVLSSGNAINGTWTFTIVSATMGGLAIGDVVSYYVIAQDVVTPTPNLTSNPSAGLVASDVNTVTTAPTTPNTYSISNTISGTYLVGASQTLTSLTQAVNMYNTSCLGGAVTFLLTDASYSAGETFPIVINSNADASATNTLTIKPQLAGTTITGNAATLIKLNGADFVTIDGSIGTTVNSTCPSVVSASRDLTISNTSTASLSSVIWLSSAGTGSGALNNTVKNCIISAGVDQSTTATETYGIVSCGATVTAFPPSDGLDNNNNTYENNFVIRSTWGIYLRGGASSSNTGAVIRQNTIGPAAFGSNQIRKGGIIVQNVDGATITGNEVRFVGNQIAQSVGGTDHVGIGIGGADGPTPTTANVTNTSVTKNTIHDIVCEKTFSAIGIMLATSNASAGNNLIANNMIYNVRTNATSPDQGIGIDVANGNGDKIVYNTINMVTTDRDPSTATTASESDMCVRFQAGSLNPTFLNNILYIDEASNTAALKNFAVVAPSAAFPWGTGVSNYNDYSINAANTQNVLFGLGTTGAAIPQVATLSAWQSTFAPAQDANSLSIVPVFTSTTDLHLVPASNAGLNNTGLSFVQVTTDYDCDTRGAVPDMGADEFCLPASTPTILATTNPLCAGSSTTLSIGTGTLNESANWQWYSGTCGGTAEGSGTSLTVSPGTTTSYFARGEGACATSGSCGTVVITVNPLPTVTATPTSATICDGASVTFAGNGAVSYVWSGPELVGDNVPFTPTVGGTYTVTGTDANNCSDTETVVLVINTNPIVGATPSSASACLGSSLTLSGTGAVSYSWSGPQTITDNTPFTATTAGTYTVTGTDANSCSDTETVAVVINTPPTVTASTSNDTVCSGTNVTLSGSGASSYAWSGPETVTDAVPFAATISGTYTVIGTDANSCSDTTTIDIFVNALPTVSYSETQTMTCINWNSITLTPGSPAGGVYSGTEVTGNTFAPDSAGVGTFTITYTYTDSNGCINSDTSSVTVDLCLGLPGNATLASVNVYPNPASNAATVDLSGLQNATVTIRVMNAVGELLQQEQTNASVYTLDLAHYAAGLYFVQVQAGAELRTLSLTVSK